MNKLKVLIVDDELGMRLGMRKILTKYTPYIEEVDEEFAFTIDMAQSGEEAIEKINAQNPDVLLLDYKLPAMSGLEVLETVHAEESEMVTIMITAYASLETAVSAIKRGAFDFLAKPFEPKELRQIVKKAVQSLILARRVRKLEQERKQVRFQFISVLGHELKAPINAVEGYINILHDKVLGNDVTSYQEMVDRSLIRIHGMKKMIADLLDLTRIESGQKKRELSVYNIVDIAKLSMETMLPDADKRDIKMTLHADDIIEMNCDSGEIEIVFNNLISNAVKYNRDTGSVDIYIDKNNNLVTVKVADTGIGMTEEETEKLFEEFVRIKNNKTRNILGSGLGLSILKKISSQYHGKVKVTSVPDKGSTFSVTFRDL